MTECGFDLFYPWDTLGLRLTFKWKGHEIVLKPDKPVQYIIIGHPNTRYPEYSNPIVIGEVQAHGKKLYDSLVPQVPKDDGPLPMNYYKETRRAVIGGQSRLWTAPSRGQFKPNHKYQDVVLAWFSDQPVSMVVTRKKAKMFLIMGHALPIEVDWLPMYTRFRESCRNWLTNGSPTANYVKISDKFQPGDVLLITRDDKFDATEIYCKLISGKNSAFIGITGGDTNDSLSKLLEMMHVDFVTTNKVMEQQFVYVSGSADSDDYIPTSYIIERYVNSWKAFSTERFPMRNEELGIEQRDVEKQVKALVEKYGTLMENLGPCDTKYFASNEHTTALINYNMILKYQYGETGFALPNIHRHPGTIASTTKPTSVVASFYADRAGKFFPLGVYAKPGEGFKWTVLENSDEKFVDQWIRVNAQTDWIDHNYYWSRWPTISTELYVRKQGEYISPHGGPLFLQLPQGVTIKIRLENVYRYPWLDLRNPKSIESFEQEVKDYSTVPWMVISGDSMNSLLRTIDVYTAKLGDVISSARFFDNAIKVMHNYRGSNWEEAMSEMFVSDLQISSGYGHSGYPWMGTLDWSRLFTLWSDSVKFGGQPGFANLLGMNLQPWEATLYGGGPVTNNVLRLIVEEILLGLKPYQGDKDTGKWGSSEYQGPGLGYYRYLGELFGYGLVGNGFIEARKSPKWGEWEKTQLWVTTMCTETGYNLVPFHKMWNFPLSVETKDVCKRLPCFFPDDEYTRPYQSKVDKVLEEFAGNCSRTEPRKVEFRGDIRRGVDTVRPQNIFLTFE
ncbi:hypothetical protein X801_01844 [Opisthorchis viverrini]|uniref:Peptidase M60 domain-containing protein n=1 Tax=Opisthorchis viverrini TaxID=6198 RepID=A0A1S8X6A9_OPIVI|nr:hypothetical protein X801_01844 [Opisthorchis viverrini]